MNLADDAAGRDSGIVDAGLQGTDLVDGGELQVAIVTLVPNRASGYNTSSNVCVNERLAYGDLRNKHFCALC